MTKFIKSRSSKPDSLNPHSVAIIICSYNGGNKLIPTIEHIAQQSISSDISVEIIYVDNASTDHSIQIVNETWNKVNRTNFSLKILEENKPGKYFALHTAIAHTTSEYFIICDDDNWLCKDYVETIYQKLSKNKEIGAIGSRSIPVFETSSQNIPKWITMNEQRYALGKQGEKSGDVTYRKQLWGAGMASRTLIYRSTYLKYPSFFLTNENEVGHFVAEDTEYCLRLILSGYRLYYDEDLYIQHFVPNQRLTLQYNDNLNKKIEASFEIIERYNLATKLYGSLAYNSMNLLRLKLLSPIRYLLASGIKKNRHQILMKFLFPSLTKKDSIIENIRLFATEK